MTIFNVNGYETDSLTEAMELCRTAHHESKSVAVLEQHRAALSKPNLLDVQRAKAGVTPNVTAEATVRLEKLASDASAAAVAAANEASQV